MNARYDLFVVSALFLFLELAFICWLPAHILFLTFFTNTVLLASFLGLALGCLAARQRRTYLTLTPVLLTVGIIVGVAMEWVRLALQDIVDVGGNKISPQMVYFGAEARIVDVASFIIPIELVAGLVFVLVALTMIGWAVPGPPFCCACECCGSLHDQHRRESGRSAAVSNMVSRDDPFPAYTVPYLLNRDTGQQQFRDILIIGAGSGNDLSRALQWASQDARIDAVEIDPVIQELGRRDHADKPYQDPRVTTHLGDGRNFLRSTNRKYDLIVFALIDSLVLHSSISKIRLESYLFTKESMADVRRCLKPDGLFVMYNYFRQGWIVSRLAKTLDEVFERRPLVLTLPHQDVIAADQKADAFTLFFAGPRAEAIQRWLQGNGFHLEAGQNPIVLRPVKVEIPRDMRVAEDVWPFLYLRKPPIPNLSWRGMAVIGFVSLALLWLFGWKLSKEQVTRSHTSMLFLGTGFMLLETKAVVHMALVYGGTWIVNTVVFSAILVMILIANVWVLKRKPVKLTRYYVALLVTLALNVAIPLHSFLGLPQVIQGIAAGALVLSPVLFAGVIFAVLSSRAEKPDQALAFNTAGAILGGLAETSSLLIGFQYLIGVAALMYLAAWGSGAGRSLVSSGEVFEAAARSQ